MEKAVETRVQEAIRAYDQAILLKPDYAKAYVNRGNVKNRAGTVQGGPSGLQPSAPPSARLGPSLRQSG